VNLASCQGPLLISGCATTTDLHNVLRLLDGAKEGFVLGGYYADTPRTRTEVVKLQTLGVHTYVQLLHSMQSVMARFLLLKRLGDFSYMRRVDGALHQTLQQCLQHKK